MNRPGPPGRHVRGRGPRGARVRGRGVASLPLIATITVTGILANTIVYPAIPDILADFGRDDGAAGILVASAAIPGIAVAPLIGLLADRFGRRRVLVPCLVVFGLCGLLAAFAPTFGWLLVARFGQGFGSAGLINLANVLISDTWTGLQRARYFGYNSAVLTVSLAILPAVGGVLTDLGGWRWTFAPYSLALLTAVVVTIRLDHGPTDRSLTVGGQIRAAATVARSVRVLVPLGLAFVMFVLVFGLLLTVLPLHLEQVFALSATERGLILATPAIGATFGALILGRLRARVSARAIILGSFGIFVLAYPLLGWAPTLILVVIAGVAFGLGEGMVLPTVTDVVASSAPDSGRGAVLSLQVSAVRLGQSVGPLLAGAAVAMVGTSSTFALGAVVAGAVVVAGLLIRLPDAPRPAPANAPAG